jgi:hypothetical protein
METMGRARELLKRRLAEDAHSEVAREMELRRKAEQRNRELEKELRTLKERSGVNLYGISVTLSEVNTFL